MSFKIRSILHSLLKALDGIFLLVSPLAILVVVVAIIVLADRAGEHNRFVRELRESGVVAEAIVDSLDPEDKLVFVRLPGEGGPSVRLVDARYYPRAFRELRVGQTIRIRYLPQGWDDRAVWEDRFADVAAYGGYALDVGVMLAAAWAIVIIHPEFLYLGYTAALPRQNRREIA